MDTLQNQLVQSIHQLQSAFHQVNPLCSCNLPATYIHDSGLLKCFMCTTPHDIPTSLHLSTIDLNPQHIIHSLTGTAQREKTVRIINQLIDAKISKLNQYRQSILQSLPGISASNCQEVLQLQLKGKQEVIEGLLSEGYIKMKESWLTMHRGLINMQYNAVKNCCTVIDYLKVELDKISLESIPIKLAVHSLPTLFELNHLQSHALNDQPRSAKLISQNHWLIGTDKSLLELKENKKKVLATNVDIEALAMMPDGTILGSDRYKKQIFKLNEDNSFRYLPHARFKDWCLGIFVRTNGEILYSDYDGHKIMKTTLYSQSCTILLQELDHATTKLSYPIGIEEINGCLIIVNTGKNQVLLIDKDKKVKSIQMVDGIGFKALRGMALNGESVVVCDYDNSRLIEIWRDDELKGRTIKVNGVLQKPRDVSIDLKSKQMVVANYGVKKTKLFQAVATSQQ